MLQREDKAFSALPLAPTPPQVVMGRFAQRSPKDILEQVLPQVTDLSWLNKGESVFLKVACNSPNDHPAVTAPAAVEAAVAFFKAHGAGRVIVGDMSGVEHVRQTATGRVSSTRALMKANGLLAAVERSGAELHNFDDQPWESWVAVTPDFAHAWEGPMYLPAILQKVDHVVYLPRLGSHALAGYTCGIKNAVGWLRDDSRRVLHQRAGTFFEKLAEINHVKPLRDKLRLVLTLGPKALVSIGPDLGSTWDFDGQFVLASTSLFAHDAVARELLPWLDKHSTSFYDLYEPYPEHADHWNRNLVKNTWGEEALDRYQPLLAPPLARPLAFDPCMARLGRLQGQRPGRLDLKRVGDALPEGLVAVAQAVAKA